MHQYLLTGTRLNIPTIKINRCDYNSVTLKVIKQWNHGIIGVHRSPPDTRAPGPPLIYLVGPLAISEPQYQYLCKTS